jgi:hypothetical protein
MRDEMRNDIRMMHDHVDGLVAQGIDLGMVEKKDLNPRQLQAPSIQAALQRQDTVAGFKEPPFHPQ